MELALISVPMNSLRIVTSINMALMDFILSINIGLLRLKYQLLRNSNLATNTPENMLNV